MKWYHARHGKNSTASSRYQPYMYVSWHHKPDTKSLLISLSARAMKECGFKVGERLIVGVDSIGYVTYVTLKRDDKGYKLSPQTAKGILAKDLQGQHAKSHIQMMHVDLPDVGRVDIPKSDTVIEKDALTFIYPRKEGK